MKLKLPLTKPTRFTITKSDVKNAKGFLSNDSCLMATTIRRRIGPGVRILVCPLAATLAGIDYTTKEDVGTEFLEWDMNTATYRDKVVGKSFVLNPA